MSALPLKFDANGLVTVVVQDQLTGEIRMLAHADEQALRATLASGEGHFYSRSRQAPWKKGESSGHALKVAEVWIDCDADAVVYLVDPVGPSCHTGHPSCFFRRLGPDGQLAEHSAEARPLFARLFMELEARQHSSGERSYTRTLLAAGPEKIGSKIREEADELARAIADESDQRVVAEAADELYHLLVGLLSRGLTLRDVELELARRFGVSGIDEKANRPQHG